MWPTSTLTAAPHEFEMFPMCDPHGYLYTSYGVGVDRGAGVNEFPGGKVPERQLITNFNLIGGVQWYNGGLWVMDGDLNALDVYYPPFRNVAKTITLSGADSTADFAIDKSIAQIVTADNDGFVGYFNMQGQLQQSTPFHYPDAIAVYP